MGITGLLPLLKKSSTPCNVRRFSGCTVGIDGYGWLHKGAFGCAAQLGKGEATTAYITYCMKYINLLLSHNIKPVLVLDGRNLPSKKLTEKKRREKREENRNKAREFLKKGMKKEAWECFSRCVDITPAMAREFIKVLRDQKIDYVVAPYEADAQLAYLARNNIVDLIITEDSDLILFGCPKIFFKMSITGDGVLFDQAKLAHSLNMKPAKFNFERFRWMCILSGCDYLPSLPGIGLGRARKVIDRSSSEDIRKMLISIPRILGLDIVITEEYIQGFIQAELTFLYQLVFDTVNRRLLPLTEYSPDIDHKEIEFAGSYLDEQLAIDMALGNVDLHSLHKLDNFEPLDPKSGYKHSSIWSPNFSIPSEPRVVSARDSKVKGNQLTGALQSEISTIILTPITKKAIKSVAPTEVEDTDEVLLSMYASSSIHDTADSTSLEAESEVKCHFENNQTLKRKRMTRSQSQSSNEFDQDNDDWSNYENKQPPPKRPSLRVNPFLKSEHSHHETESEERSEISEKALICLVQKNKVYGRNSKVIVKSQYFRNEDCTEEILKRPKSKVDEFLTTSQEDNLSEEESQLTIYSVEENRNDSETELEPTSLNTFITDEDPEPYNSEVFKIDDEIPSLNRLTFRKPSKASPPSLPKRSKKTAGYGMSKSALKSKKFVDPKQQKISTMFALQPRPKM